jgi:hypothetical protein
MNRKEIESQQKQILESIFSDNNTEKHLELSGIIKKILGYDDDVVSLALGEFGKKLKEFVGCIDLDHPDIGSICEGQLAVGVISDKLCQALQLARFAKENNLSSVLESVPKIIFSTLPDSLKRLDIPIRNRRFVRFLSDRQSRELVRKTKKVQTIDLRLFYRKSSVWSSIPEDFAMSVRNNDSYKIEVEKGEKKAARFKALGCEEMSKNIMDVVNVFRADMQDVYYGFHRITMTRAAVILAKMHDCKLSKNSFLTGDLNCIDTGEFSEIRRDGDQRAIYKPRVYPYREFSPPTIIGELVERLESFCGGKAIFDHYVLVVPTVECPNKEMDLDHFLVETKSVLPVLLGEVDGKCYFICYWA